MSDRWLNVHEPEEAKDLSFDKVMIFTNGNFVPGWVQQGTFWVNKPGIGKISVPYKEIKGFLAMSEVKQIF